MSHDSSVSGKTGYKMDGYGTVSGKGTGIFLFIQNGSEARSASHT